MRNLTLRTETRVGGTPVDFGTLSARSVVTGSDGKATLVYTAPPRRRLPVVRSSSWTSSSRRSAPTSTTPPCAARRFGWCRRDRSVRRQPGRPDFTVSSPLIADTPISYACSSTRSHAVQGRDRGVPAGTSATATRARAGLTIMTTRTSGTYVVTLTRDRRLSAGSRRFRRSITVAPGRAADGRLSCSRRQLKSRVRPSTSTRRRRGRRREARIASYQWDFGDGTPLRSTGGPVTSKTYCGRRHLSGDATRHGQRGSRRLRSTIDRDDHCRDRSVTVMTETPRLEELKRRVQRDPASISFAALAEEYRRLGMFRRSDRNLPGRAAAPPGVHFRPRDARPRARRGRRVRRRHRPSSSRCCAARPRIWQPSAPSPTFIADAARCPNADHYDASLSAMPRRRRRRASFRAGPHCGTVC